MLRRLPLVLLMMIAVGTLGDVAWLLGSRTFNDPSAGYASATKWFVLARGCGLVESLFLVFGMFELARRLEGRQAKAARIAGWMFSVLFTWYVTSFLLQAFPSERVREVSDYLARGTSIVVYGGIAATLVAGRAWRRVPIAMVLVILIAPLRNWFPYLTDFVRDLIEDRDVWMWWELALAVGWTLSFSWLLVSIANAAREPFSDVQRAERGFHWASRSLWLRVVAAAVIAMVTLATSRSKPSLAIVFVLGSGVVVVSIVMFAYGLAEAAASRLAGLCGWLVLLSVVPLVWSLASQLNLLSKAIAILLEKDISGLEDPYPITTSIAVAAGLALIGIAIGRMRADADPGLGDAASSTVLGFALLTTITLVIQRWARPTTRDEMLVMLLLLAAASIFSIVLLARLFGRASRALRPDAHDLPTARVL